MSIDLAMIRNDPASDLWDDSPMTAKSMLESHSQLIQIMNHHFKTIGNRLQVITVDLTSSHNGIAYL
eukprot:56716-Eustigmatos_ZCMA.PRE.1